jgi:two-component system NtrC family sensor kinase
MIRIRSLVSLPPPRATFVEIAVKDNGGGVSPDTRGTLFEHGAGGRGEGLAQCRQIVEANGGSITCEPEDWGRTCFRITLPHA